MTAGNVIYFSALEKELTDEEKERIRQRIRIAERKTSPGRNPWPSSRRPLPAGSHYHDQVDLTWDKCRQTRDYLVTLGIEAERIQMVVSTASAPGGATEDPQLLTHDSRVDLLLLGSFLEQQRAPSRSMSKPANEPASRQRARLPQGVNLNDNHGYSSPYRLPNARWPGFPPF